MRARLIFSILVVLACVVGDGHARAQSPPVGDVPWPATSMLVASTITPYATDKNAYAVADASLIGTTEWFAYGRVVELAEQGFLQGSLVTRMRDAFWNAGAPPASDWPARLGGTWISTTTTPLPLEQRRRGLIALWTSPAGSYLAIVEEVSADRQFYRATGYSRWNRGSRSDQWFGFSQPDELWNGVRPSFYELPVPSGVANPVLTTAAVVTGERPLLSLTQYDITFTITNKGGAPAVFSYIGAMAVGRTTGSYAGALGVSNVILAAGQSYTFRGQFQAEKPDTYDAAPAFAVNGVLYSGVGQSMPMPVDAGVTSVFELVILERLTVNVWMRGGYGGSVTGQPPLSCDVPLAMCWRHVAPGTTVAITQTPDSRSVFVSWEGCDAVSGATCTIVATSGRHMMAVANFDYRDKITITSGPTVSPAEVDSIGQVTATVSAVDSLGHPLVYRWMVQCHQWSIFVHQWIGGPSFSWTMPANASGRDQSCSVSVVVDDEVGGYIAYGSTSAVVRPQVPASPGTPPDADSYAPVVSFSGRYVVFLSHADNLVSGDHNERPDIFRWDRVTGDVRRLETPLLDPNGSDLGSLTDDGRFFSYVHRQAYPLPSELRVFDWETGQHELANVDPSLFLLSPQSAGALSVDGRYLTFTAIPDGRSPHYGPTNVWLLDRLTGAATKQSRARDGGDPDGVISPPVLSPDGGFVAFSSTSTNLLTRPDGNYHADIFVRDVRGAITRRASEAVDGTPGNGDSWRPAVSQGGRVVAFLSYSSNLVDGDTNKRQDAFVKDMESGAIERLVRRTPADEEWTTLDYPPRVSADGRYVTFVAYDGTGRRSFGLYARRLIVQDRRTGAQYVAAEGTDGPLSGDGRLAVVPSTIESGLLPPARPIAALVVREWGAEPDPGDYPDADGDGRIDGLSTVTGRVQPASDTDLDGDGLPNGWEESFGFDPVSMYADDGPNGDPDGDGVKNLDEYRNGTHPNGLVTSYLAEGATGDFLRTRLALLNADETRHAHVMLRFQRSDGQVVSHVMTVPAATRRTLDVEAVAEMASAEFSTVIESDVRVIVDRTMTWDRTGYGSHAESAVGAPAQEWYLAEGATHSGFQLFYLLQNPNPDAATITITYLLPAPRAPVVRAYVVAPASRQTVWVNADVDLTSTDVSASIRSDRPVVVERAMYLDAPERVFAAGHESAALRRPSETWFLAEGATGRFFDLFILLANPRAAEARVTVDYLLPEGRVVTRTYDVAALSRFTIWVDQEGDALADTAVSARIRSTQPILVERAMWWPGPTAATWTEAHNSPGATLPATFWALAEGEEGGPQAAETYILIANTSPFPGMARVRLFPETGAVLERMVDLPANSRVTVPVRADPMFGGFGSTLLGQRFGTTVESLATTSGSAAFIVVERAMYTTAAGVPWAAGTNALGFALR